MSISSDTVGTKIVYTTNGSNPAVDVNGNTTNGLDYSSAITVGTAATTLKAVAWKLGLGSSYLSTGLYTFNTTSVAIPTPTFDVWPLTDDGTQFVSVLCATPGALVRYTIDGSTPTTTAGTLAAAASIAVTSGNIIKAIAYKSGRANSTVLSGNFVVRPRIGSLSEGSTITVLGANKIRYSRFQPVSPLTVTKIYAKVGVITGNYRAAIYADAAGVPSTLLRSATAPVTNPAAGWQAFTLSSALALADKDSLGNDIYYWLAIWSDQAAASVYASTTGGTSWESTATFATSFPSTAPMPSASANPTYNYSIFATTNYRPVVSAGGSQTLPTPASVATLTGLATDNSTPPVPLKSGVLTTTWSKFSGPGNVTFASSTSLATTATFSQPGTYVLRLTGQDLIFTPFAPVTSDVTIIVTPASMGVASATGLVANNDLATIGNPVTFTATVTGGSGTPAGTVTFYDGGVSLGTGTLDGLGVATFSTSSLAVGSHSITAAYAGNLTYATSVSPAVNQTILLLDGTTRALAINATGPAIAGSGFVADTGFVGGAGSTVTAAINRSAVSNPAPEAVYQSERYGTFDYVLGGLSPFTPYLVRLHFCENYFGVGTRINNTVGERKFHVSINGVQRLSNFDVWAAAGASNKAVIKEFSAAADETGQLLIHFTSVVNNALVQGLEVYTLTAFDSWRVNKFSPLQVDDPAISGISADYDRDGLTTLQEYALDGDPTENSAAEMPQLGLDEDGTLTLGFLRARADVNYLVQGSSDLLLWTTIETNPGSVGSMVTVSDNAPAGASPRFLRLKIVR